MLLKLKSRLLLSLCFFLTACQNGCTTSSTMDSESKTIQVQGHAVQVTARLVDYRNSKRIGDNIFRRSVTHTYGVSFDIRTKGYSGSQFYSESIADPDNVDLIAELKRVKVDFSKDLNHLGLGVDDKVVDVVHFYKGKVLELGIQNELFDVNKLDNWSDLDLNSYPSPEELMLTEIQDNCTFSFMNSQTLHEFMGSLKKSDTSQRMFLAQWPSCSLVDDFFTDNRVAKYSQNGTWKQYALDRCSKIMTYTNNDREMEDAIHLLRVMNVPEANYLIDSTLASSWGGSMETEMTELLVERMTAKKNKLKPELRNAVVAEAERGFSKFVRTGNSDHNREPAACLKVLIASGDTSTTYRFLEDSFGKNNDDYWFSDFLETVYDNYESFTPYQKSFVKKQTPLLFDRIPDYYRSLYFSAVEKFVECSQLKKWKNKYPEDLEFASYPDHCKEG